MFTRIRGLFPDSVLLMSGGRQLPGLFSRVFMIVPAVMLVFFFFYPVKKQLVVENAESGTILYSAGCGPKMGFGISYIHSVNKSKITDFFTIDEDGTVFLVSSRFSSFGAGVASSPEGTGFFSIEKDEINYSGINRKIDDLVVFVGTVADHHLILPESDIKLIDIAPAQTSLRFRADRLSAAELVFNYFRKGALHG